jgi:hypothetical protein
VLLRPHILIRPISRQLLPQNNLQKRGEENKNGDLLLRSVNREDLLINNRLDIRALDRAVHVLEQISAADEDTPYRAWFSSALAPSLAQQE